MGKNNQQRRAAKRKARVAAQAASARPAGGAAAGEAGSAAQLTEELMAGTAHQVHQHSRADQARTLIITGAKVVGIPSALDDAVRDLVVFGGADGRGEELLASREATVLLFEQIDTAYEHGWQPADLLHVVRREQSVRVARLAGAVVVAHGLAGRDEVVMMGCNSRLDTTQAVIGNWLIEQVDFITSTRIKHAGILDKGLSTIAQITIPPRFANRKLVYHLYMVFAERRDELLAYCKEAGIQAKVHYPVPVYRQPAVIELCNTKEGDFPVADRHGKTMISFPAHEHLTEDQLHYMIDTVKRFYQG